MSKLLTDVQMAEKLGVSVILIYRYIILKNWITDEKPNKITEKGREMGGLRYGKVEGKSIVLFPEDCIERWEIKYITGL